jgi:hypothetical protein
MLKTTSRVVAFVGVCALISLLLSCGSSSSRPTGVLYVETQGLTAQGTPGIGFNVTSFAINLNNGSLSAINDNASTCSTMATQENPSPCGAPLDILVDPTGATAFVLNQGIPCLEIPNGDAWQCEDPMNDPPVLPTIYPYTVNSDGSLSSPLTAVTWSCAGLQISPGPCSDNPVAIARDAAGQFLFVISQGSYPHPGYPNAYNDNPSCPHTPQNQTDVCPSISVFAMQPGSTNLALESGSPYYLSKVPTGLSAIEFTPGPGNPLGTSPIEILFVSNNEDICPDNGNCKAPSPHNDNTVSVYQVDLMTGALSEQPNSPYTIAANNPVSVLAVNTNPVGEYSVGGIFVYVGNSGASGGDLNPFVLCTVAGDAGCSSADVQNTLLIPLEEVCPEPPCNNVPPSPAGQNPAAMVVDPTNSFLYAVSNGGSSAVFGFTIDETSGTLTPLSTPSEPTGANPVGLALQPSVGNSGQYLYVSNSNSANITGLTLDTADGAMSSPITVSAPPGPTGIAVH